VRVLFVCVANSGRSVLAERLFRRAAAGRHETRSAGSKPGTAAHTAVAEALAEVGLDVRDHVPQRLDAAVLAWADLVVSTCSDEICPVTPGVERIRWELPDPKGRSLAEVRELRDEIGRRVEALVARFDAK
jgi:arsenate reductase (thioredoxin)